MTAPTPWQSVTAHSVGDVIQAFTDPGTGFFWVCSQWQKAIDEPFRAVIRATFKQVFEP